MEGTRSRWTTEDTRIVAFGMGWFTLYFAVRFFLEAHPQLSSAVRLALAFLPTPVFALFLWRFIQSVRKADEMERRIHLEALALAFPMGLLLLTTLGLVQRAVTLNFQDWSYNHVWLYFVLFWGYGLISARKRYL